MPTTADTMPARVMQHLRHALRLAEHWERVQAKRPHADPPGTSPEASPFRVTHYGDKFWALYEGDTLLAVTVYKRGAESLRQALEAREAVIAAQAARIAHLTAAGTARPEPRASSHTRFRGRVRAGEDEQLGLFAEAERARDRVQPQGASGGRG